MKLIKDLGVVIGNRRGIYECPLCKTHFEVRSCNINSGNTTKCRKCASKLRKSKHGRKHHKLYSLWCSQRQRCYSINNKDYNNYGGRGIKMSEEFNNNIHIWLAYVEYLPNAYKKGYTIDRINNDGNYERGNLRWASKAIQSRNRRTIHKNNTSGYKGVHERYHGKWISRIMINYKRIILGSYNSPNEAALSYDKYVIENNLEHTLNFEDSREIFKVKTSLDIVDCD